MIEKSEFIGVKAQVLLDGQEFAGTIVDETKNTIRLKSDGRIRTIIKQNARIIIDDHIIDGKKIAKRPEDRIKGYKK